MLLYTMYIEPSMLDANGIHNILTFLDTELLKDYSFPSLTLEICV